MAEAGGPRLGGPGRGRSETREAGWQSLAHAVVLQAVDELACCRAGVMPRNMPSGMTMEMAERDAERFLRSGWCYLLCGVCGDELVRGAELRAARLRFRMDHGCAHCKQYATSCPHHHGGPVPDNWTAAKEWQGMERETGQTLCRAEAEGPDGPAAGATKRWLPPGCVDASEAARLAGVARRTVTEWVRKGKVDWGSYEGGHWVIDRARLMEWIRERDGDV